MCCEPAILGVLPIVVVCGLRDRKRVGLGTRHEAAVSGHALEHLCSPLEEVLLRSLSRVSENFKK